MVKFKAEVGVEHGWEAGEGRDRIMGVQSVTQTSLSVKRFRLYSGIVLLQQPALYLPLQNQTCTNPNYSEIALVTF